MQGTRKSWRGGLWSEEEDDDDDNNANDANDSNDANDANDDDKHSDGDKDRNCRFGSSEDV